MSPYGAKLFEILRRENMSQKALALTVEILPNHLSQVLRGTKGPFREATQQKICDALQLNKEERDELAHLASISSPLFRIRKGAQVEEYQMMALLSDRTSATSPSFIDIAKLAIAAHEFRERLERKGGPKM